MNPIFAFEYNLKKMLSGFLIIHQFVATISNKPEPSLDIHQNSKIWAMLSSG